MADGAFLKTLASSGDQQFTDQWNHIVRSVKAFQKMHGEGYVNVTWISGVPTISLRKLPDIAGIGKADGTISARASGTISVWAGTFGSESDTTVNQTMFNLSVANGVVAGDWVSWQIINGQYGFVKLC